VFFERGETIRVRAAAVRSTRSVICPSTKARQLEAGGEVNKTIREVALLLVERLRAHLGGDNSALDDLRVELLEEGVSEETIAGALAWLRAGAAGGPGWCPRRWQAADGARPRAKAAAVSPDALASCFPSGGRRLGAEAARACPARVGRAVGR
jgi:hypothetical protein